MISYILIGMILLSAWIALLSEWKCRSSIKPCNLAQITLDELYNKSYERFMLGKCQENTSIGLKLRFKLYRDATLTCVDQSRTVLAWSCTLNKSWSPCYVQQTLFLDQELDQLVSKSKRALKLESMAVLRSSKFDLVWMTEFVFWVFVYPTLETYISQTRPNQLNFI